MLSVRLVTPLAGITRAVTTTASPDLGCSGLCSTDKMTGGDSSTNVELRAPGVGRCHFGIGAGCSCRESCREVRAEMRRLELSGKPELRHDPGEFPGKAGSIRSSEEPPPAAATGQGKPTP